nr:hypothetical protein [Gammaproteobacteria bacterium]
DFINDEEMDEADRENFRILLRNKLEDRQRIEDEHKKTYLSLEAKQNIGAAFAQIFKSYQQDVFNLMINVNDAIHAQILELNPNEETNRVPKEKLEKKVKKIHVHLQRHSQIQNKHDEKKAKAAAKIENFRAILQAQIREAQKEAKVEQKNNLRKLHESILGKKNEIQIHLNEDQVSAFGQFLHQLEKHYQNIDATDTPQALQAILGDCAKQLGSFMNAIESIPDAEAFISHLEEVGGYFLNLSHKKVNVAHIPVPDISQIEEKPLPKTPELPDAPEASNNTPSIPEKPVMTQQKLKAMVSAIREGNTQEKLSPIPEDNQEDAEELLEKIAKLFKKAKANADPPFAEDSETVKQVETLIKSLQSTFEKTQSIRTSDIDELKLKTGTLFDAHPELSELSRITTQLNKLTKLMDEPDNTHQLNGV